MNRAASILIHLETMLSATPEALAARFGVGTKTIAADVAALNDSLGGLGSLRLVDGRYRLLIVDEEGYRRFRGRLTDTRESFNDPQWRVASILARLLRSKRPIRTEDLAREMRLGRTTVVADVSQLRKLLEPYGIAVEGKTHVGLSLTGTELGIRLAVLEHAYVAAYRDYPLGDELNAALDEVLLHHQLNVENGDVIRRWFTVTLDRHLTDHTLNELPPAYRDLVDTPAHDFAKSLAARVEPLLAERLPDAEVLFLAIPVAGMRTPADGAAEAASPSTATADDLVERILDRINDEMDVRLVPSELLREFSQHIVFMLNRMRYSLHVSTAPQWKSVREEYPTAYRMATIAQEVVAERTGIVMSGGELSLMTTYSQVFLEDHAARHRRQLSVTIVAGRGPATARLVRSNLATVLPNHTRYTIVPDSAPGDLDASDLVVTTPGTRVETSRPTLELSEVFDRQALVRRLRAMRIPTHGPLSPGGSSGSLLVSMLDEGRFVRLPPSSTYLDGTQHLIRRLRELGLVGDDFEAAIMAREQRSTMQLDDEVAFPHATAANIINPVCALGVISLSDQQPGLRLIFLMAVPEKAAYDDTILIRVYDEIIRLGSNRAALTKMSRLTTYEQFFYFMENLSTHPQL